MNSHQRYEARLIGTALSGIACLAVAASPLEESLKPQLALAAGGLGSAVNVAFSKRERFQRALGSFALCAVLYATPYVLKTGFEILQDMEQYERERIEQREGGLYR
jgi:hypothetical protein